MLYCVYKLHTKKKKIATTTTEMDLFDLVRAAPPPKNVREPTGAAAQAKSEENDGKGDQKAGNTLKTKRSWRSPEAVDQIDNYIFIHFQRVNLKKMALIALPSHWERQILWT